jgi:1-phosphatidylinositol phosphodiesterase
MHYRIPRVTRMIPTAAVALGLVAIQVSYADTNPYSHDSSQKTTNLSWMTYMSDSVTLNQLSVPGSHDTMTYGYQPGFGLGNLFTGQNIPTDPVPIPKDNVVTQSMDLATQLNSGLRMLDIRCKDIFNQFLIYHGDFYVGATFEDVLNTVTAFLTAHPGEAVLMRVTNEGPGAPLNVVQDTEDSSLSWETVFSGYYGSSKWSSFFYNPQQTETGFNFNPTLGQIRGKIVVLQQFTSSVGRVYGIPYANFNPQDDYGLNSIWDLYSKWQEVKNHLAAAASDPNGAYINFLSASQKGVLTVYPYFVASGKSSSGTNDPQLWTGLVSDSLTGANVNTYPDFPRANCADISVWTPSWSNPWGTTTDHVCSIMFAGTDQLTYSYLNSNFGAHWDVNRTHTGIVLGDFFGPGLIDQIIAENSRMTSEIDFPSGQLPQPGGGLSSCLGRPSSNYTIAANGWEHLVWQTDGNLVVYDEKGFRWATGTNSPTVNGLCWQGDGNLVVYDPGKVGGVGWAAGTGGRGVTLKFLNDCTLGIQDASGNFIWTARGTAPCASGDNVDTPTVTGAIFSPSGSLATNQKLVSSNGLYRATMQGDGNFVIYDQSSHAIWATNTNGHEHAPYTLDMQGDGNVVLYSDGCSSSSPCHATWASNTNGKGVGPYYLIMQNDGNLVVYDSTGAATWASNTAR